MHELLMEVTLHNCGISIISHAIHEKFHIAKKNENTKCKKELKPAIAKCMSV